MRKLTHDDLVRIKDGLKLTPGGAFMLADFLEKGDFRPTIKYDIPKWKLELSPGLSAVGRTARVPAINWTSPELAEVPEGTAMVDIDANGAYLSAGSSASFAFDQLENTGPHDPERDYIDPGYYLVDSHAWMYGAPGHPLGADPGIGKRVWITHPTYFLLRELTYGGTWAPGGHWPALQAYDSWTSKTSCRLTEWTSLIRDLRKLFLEEDDRDGYEALKLGYSQAIQMWMVPPDPKGTPRDQLKKKNQWFRPDWYHTLRAQHAFNMWRRAYIAHLKGHGPLQVGGAGHMTDGMLFREDDLKAILAEPKGPIRMDDTGTALGTFKRDPERSHYYWGMDEVDGQ